MPQTKDMSAADFRFQWQRLSSSADAGGLVAELLFLAGAHATAGSYLSAALPLVRGAASAEWTGLLAADKGSWTNLASDGDEVSLPTELLADCLDADRAVGGEDWLVAPLFARQGSQELLAVYRGDAGIEQVDAMAAAVGVALQTVRRRHANESRIRRLETILTITDQWNRTRETEPLLVQMAEAATRLLKADRASIFLWDRANKTLVGRPALGVEDNELRIPDDAGVVGQVVQTGEPLRVDRREAEEMVDREVDKKLGYETQTLLCVPLRASSGELFGAFELINKLEGNFSAADEAGLIELAAHAATALENTQELECLVSANRRLVDEAAGAVRMIGESPPIEALRSTIQRVADTELAVSIFGENGTGKEVVSQMIHFLSGRRDQLFVAVNCAAIPENLLESELFGHEKGAFTDAHEQRIGKFELASAGTLFLDEIGDLSPGGQAKLLRVIEEKVVVRVGGSQPIHTDARVIAATNQNLSEMVRQRQFREDLYFRLNVVTLELPPLRDRGDDIVLLADHFLRDFCGKAGRKMPKLMAGAKKRLRAHNWPGNIRELRNLMERLAYLTNEEKIEAEELEFILSPRATGPSSIADDLPLADATGAFQQQYINRAIERSGTNMSEAAARLGLHRSNLYRKMRQLGMGTDD
ncbi:MAG: sigma-54-dependent Fis family transcriptional regulator [Pirellulales bacterium]